MEFYLGRSTSFWLGVRHVMDQAGINSPKELEEHLRWASKRNSSEIQLTPDEAGYYFGMDPERSQWWFDATAYANGRHPWHFSVADR